MLIRTALTTLAIAAILGWGTTIDDHSAEQDMADDLEAAERQASADATYQRQVQRLCGDNAGWMELHDGAIQCTTKRGTPTRRVTLITTTTPEPTP